MEKFVDIVEVGKLAGEIGNKKQIEEYISFVPESVAFGLCKSGRFNLLRSFHLTTGDGYIFPILTGLASGNHYRQIEEWLSKYKIDFDSPIDPIIEACKNGSLESVKILFPYYLNMGIDVNNLIIISHHHHHYPIFNYLLPFAIHDKLLPLLPLNEELIKELIKSVDLNDLIFHLLDINHPIVIPSVLIPNLLQMTIAKDNPHILEKLIEKGLKLEEIDCRQVVGKSSIVKCLAQKKHPRLLSYLDSIFRYSNMKFCRQIVKFYLDNTNILVLSQQYPESKILKMMGKKI